MNSEQLKQCQSTLEHLAKIEIDSPMTNMIKLKRLLKVIDETWNDEKFGDSENIVNMIISDDIPF